MTKSREIRLKSRPNGVPTAAMRWLSPAGLTAPPMIAVLPDG